MSIVEFAKSGGPTTPARAHVADSLGFLREYWLGERTTDDDFFEGVRMFLRRHDQMKEDAA